MTILNELKENVSDITENVVRKTTEIIETQKLKMNKASIESDIRDAYVSLGRMYEKFLNEAADTIEIDEQAAELLEKIAAGKKTVAGINDTLMKAKGLIHCDACGNDVARSSAFCPKCGAKLEKPEDKEEKVNPEDVSVEGEAKTPADEEKEENPAAEEPAEEPEM